MQKPKTWLLPSIGKRGGGGRKKFYIEKTGNWIMSSSSFIFIRQIKPWKKMWKHFNDFNDRWFVWENGNPQRFLPASEKLLRKSFFLFFALFITKWKISIKIMTQKRCTPNHRVSKSLSAAWCRWCKHWTCCKNEWEFLTLKNFTLLLYNCSTSVHTSSFDQIKVQRLAKNYDRNFFKIGPTLAGRVQKCAIRIVYSCR